MAGERRRCFLASLPPALREEATALADLEERLEALWQAGAAAWPGISLAAEAFAEHCATVVKPGGELGAQLARLRAPELFLTCACARGVPAAVGAFEKAYLGEVALRGLGVTRVRADEVQQALRERLLVSRPGTPPRIGTYSGTGELGNWVRVAAMRVAVNLATREPKEVLAGDERLMGHAAGPDDPEFAFIKREYAEEVGRIFPEALSALALEDRNLLRYRYLDGLSIDQIAPIFGFHRATAARKLARARAALLDEVRGRLVERLRISPTEFQSIVRLVRSQLQVSLSTVFASRSGGS